jgi:hypothetical protein
MLIIDFIVNNKEWLFSGVGIVIITTVVTLLLSNRTLRHDKKKTLMDNMVKSSSFYAQFKIYLIRLRNALDGFEFFDERHHCSVNPDKEQSVRDTASELIVFLSNTNIPVPYIDVKHYKQWHEYLSSLVHSLALLEKAGNTHHFRSFEEGQRYLRDLQNLIMAITSYIDNATDEFIGYVGKFKSY